jgi:hypothetical protein
MAHRHLLGARERKNEIVGTIAEPPNTEADLLDPYLLRSPLRAIYYCKYDLLQVRSKNMKSGYYATDSLKAQSPAKARFRITPKKSYAKFAEYLFHALG